ncbi:hypothetical protein Ahy_B08g091985 [Arachis hypogaea]|uniref:Aminotransferase-like plant mobile domain-containing protein n=1 Tax=Arachis hypogaea TaxID=3818 RepID=A0A444Y2Z1_ARAHY|nr:hypothetical protein Ahy_B08g091985 [Arachis hypogaea]
MATSSHHLSTSPLSSSKVAICDKSVVKNDSAFVGPIISPKVVNKIKNSFPGHPRRKPVTFQDFIPIGYFDSNDRLFRNPPKTNIEGYHAWLGRSFILNNKGQDRKPVSDNEHIAFLLYWLSGIVFYTRSIQVEVTYLPLAIMLAEGKRLCLAKLFLARLYLTLDWITVLMREKKRITNVDDSVIAGHHLLNLIFADKLMASHDKMKHFFCAFYYLPEKDHNINLTPFANC